MRTYSTRHFVYVTLLAAMAIVLNIFESSFIPPMSFGIRFGLANIIALITIELFGIRDMLIVNAMRVLIGNLMRGMIFSSTFFISSGGVILSSLILIGLHQVKSSHYFTGVGCSIAHSVGQVIVVIFLYNQPAVMAIVPYLLLGSVPTGFLTGWVGHEALKRLDKMGVTLK